MTEDEKRQKMQEMLGKLMHDTFDRMLDDLFFNPILYGVPSLPSLDKASSPHESFRDLMRNLNRQEIVRKAFDEPDKYMMFINKDEAEKFVAQLEEHREIKDWPQIIPSEATDPGQVLIARRPDYEKLHPLRYKRWEED